MSEQKNSPKQYVKDLNFKDKVHTTFVAKNKSLLKDKNGNSFIVASLKDKSGSMTAMIWDNAESFDKAFASGDLVSVKGHVQNYNDKKQIVIHHIEKNESGDLNMEDYFDKVDMNPQEMWKELVSIVDEIQNEQIKELIQNTFSSSDVKDRLLRFPAAKSIHHAKVGGLLEHILSISKTMKFYGKHYPFLDEDLLVFGAIYHDIGKLWELDMEDGFQYTTRGRLIGHMAIACELLDEKSSQILGFSQELKDKLKHIILSHHGRLEYGSPKRPKFLEALVVAMVDEIDSKIASMHEFLKEESGTEDEWTRYSKNFDRYLLKN